MGSWAGGAGLQGGGGVAVAAQDLASCHQLALHVAGVGAVTDPAAQVGAGVLDAAWVGADATVNGRQDSMRNQALALLQRAQTAIEIVVIRPNTAEIDTLFAASII